MNKKFVEKGSLVDEFRVNDWLIYLSSSSFGPGQDVVSNTRSSTSIRVDLGTEYIYIAINRGKFENHQNFFQNGRIVKALAHFED